MKINTNNYLRQNSAFPRVKGVGMSSFSNVKDDGNFSSPDFEGTKLTFSGINTSKIASSSDMAISGAKKFFAKNFMEKSIVVSDYTKLSEETNVLLGNDFLSSRIREFQDRMGVDSSRFIQLEDNKLVIYDRKVAGKLLSGVLDVAKLPIDILGAAIKGISKLPGIRNTKASNALNNISFIQKRSNEKTAMDLFYKIKGIAELQDTPFKIRRTILSVPAGNAVGNYNTKDERGLNRLMTGGVSSVFVGMDFYNLVMYEKNNKEEAAEAAKKRRKRELTRIGINAFMTYSVLGALSSYASRSKAFACAAIAGSALFAEVATRLIAGTPLVPLSPEGVKKYNAKQLKKQKQKTDNPENNTFALFKKKEDLNSQKTSSNNLKTQNSSIQGALYNKPVDNIFNCFTNTYKTPVLNETKADLKFKGDNQTKEEKVKKSPITLNRMSAALLVITAANIIFGLARSKSSRFNGYVENIQDKFANFYKKYSTKELIVNSKDLRKLLEGFGGNSIGSIKEAYSRVLDVSFTKDEAAKLLAGSKDGIVKIESDSEIFAKAFSRTSKRVVEKYADMFSKNNADIDYSITSKMLTDEITDISNLEAIKSKAKDVKSYQKFKTITCSFDFENPVVVDGINYYKMKDAVYNFGKIKETRRKIIMDAISYPFKAVRNILTAPGNFLRKLSGVPTEKEIIQANKSANADPFPIPDIGELYKDCSVMFKKYNSGKISKEEFAKYINNVNTKLLNTDTTPRYPQTALASLSRNFVTLITSYFFINDFRNEVLIQSNGENTEKAKEVTNERIAHKLSNFVLNKFFMELFNSTFQKYYLGSLTGAAAVAAATELTNESCVRASIGVPIGNRGSREEIEEFERKHLEQKGIKGAYYRLMARLTGKKMLSEKAEK